MKPETFTTHSLPVADQFDAWRDDDGPVGGAAASAGLCYLAGMAQSPAGSALKRAEAIAQLTELEANASLRHRRRSQSRQESGPHVPRAHAEFMAERAAEARRVGETQFPGDRRDWFGVRCIAQGRVAFQQTLALDVTGNTARAFHQTV